MSAPNKSLLVVKMPAGAGQADLESLRAYLQSALSQLNLEPLVIEDGMDAQLHHNLDPLIGAITKQTQAINRLATSNEMLVLAMAESEGVDEQRIPSVGLNGRPL